MAFRCSFCAGHVTHGVKSEGSGSFNVHICHIRQNFSKEKCKVIMFFSERLPLSLKYLLDKRSFLREPPYSHLISDIPEIMEMDFDQDVRQKKGIHFQLYL